MFSKAKNHHPVAREANKEDREEAETEGPQIPKKETNKVDLHLDRKTVEVEEVVVKEIKDRETKVREAGLDLKMKTETNKEDSFQATNL